jgi:transposase
LHGRVGKDGKARPITTSNGRRVAAELIRVNETMSLREVAKIAGISPTTVRDVRVRLEQGAEPVATDHTQSQPSSGDTPSARDATVTRTEKKGICHR